MADAHPVARLARMQSLLARIRAGEPDLTERQRALLMLICLTEGPHRTRDLAETMCVGKPIVCRAMNTLASLGFMRRQSDPHDRRECYAVATDAGRDFLERLG